MKFSWGCALAVAAVAVLSGCAAQPDGKPTPPPPQAVTITVQPASQTVPMGLTATFTVSATGTGPLSYQWYEGKYPISGATAASYTTPDVTLEDTGDTFTVVVSNSASSVTSTVATLATGARSPMPGDLRFQQVDSPSEADQGEADGASMSFSDQQFRFASNATGSPIEMTGYACYPNIPNDCAWSAVAEPLPTGMTGLTITYYGGYFSSLTTDLSQGLQLGPTGSASPNSVITSLDLEPANNAYAMAWATSSQATGFDMKVQTVAPGAVTSTVAADAAQSRVVTAVSFDDSSGKVDLISYGWQQNTTTVYDTMVLEEAADDVESAATTLANDGYILTAFGGNLTDGFLLIGTKVQGDRLPRPIRIVDQSNGPHPEGWVAGYAPVASLSWGPAGALAGNYATIFEK